jgi:hypothetical protein
LSALLVLCAILVPVARGQQTITTYSAGAPGDLFGTPTDLTLDKFGNLFVSDAGKHRVQRIDKQTQAVVTIAGTGTAGYAGDGGPATQAQLDCPAGLAFDGSGNLYITDPCQNVVRKVVPGADSVISGASDEIITTFAGNGRTDACAWTDGVPATQTSVDSPYRIAIDQGGNVFIISSDCYDIVRRVDASSMLISTPAYTVGNRGTNSMVFDNSGNLFISIFSTIEICSPTSGPYLSGNEYCMDILNGSFNPLPRAFDKAGNLFFSDNSCDGGNCDWQIFQAIPGANGVIGYGSTFSVYAGNGLLGYSGDGGSPLNASFRSPAGMVVDDAGNLFIADTGNSVIRMVSAGPMAPLLNSHPPNPNNQATATFTFSDSDTSVTAFVCTLDGLANSCTSPVTYSGLADGSHTFSVLGKTASGTSTNSVSYTWVVDTVPPPMPSINSSPSNPSFTANATFTFSDAEAGVAFMCNLDGSGSWCSGTIAYSGLADGSHTFSVTATDAAGNQSAPNLFSWTIQTTPPPSPQITSAPAALSNQSLSSFGFSDAQSGVTFVCQMDAAQAAPCTSPAIYIGLVDGTHTFSVIASDPTSGRSSAPATFTWTIDTTPPKVAINGGTGIAVIPAPSIFYFSSGSNDVVGYQCSVDGGGFSPCSSPVSMTITTPGVHNLVVEAVDAVGNIGSAQIQWTVTYCRCNLYGDYANPAFGSQTSTTSNYFKVQTTLASDGVHLTSAQLVDNNGAVVYSLPTTIVSWEFGVDSTYFLYWSRLPWANSPVEATVLDLSTSPAKRVLTFSTTGGNAFAMFSPSGAYVMVVSTVSVTQNAISIYRIRGVSQAVLVYSSQFAPFSGSGMGVAAWGFNNNPYGEPEVAFMYAWVSGQNTVNWNVANLEQGKQVLSQSSVLGSGFWQFNPCGTIIAFVSQPSANEEQVDLFSTESGVHLGETSFPLQQATISSIPDHQEVAKITTPQQQTITIFQDNCGPNTPTGTNVSVSPVCQQNNTSPVSVTFSDVSQEGGTGVTSSSTGNAPPGNFQVGNPPVFYDISTSAGYSGEITICINYAGITFSGTPRLFHFENGAWVDRTTSVDTTTQTVCGTVSSLSPFALFSQPIAQAPAITSAASVTFLAGAGGSFTVLTSGTPTPALSESGALPAGISFVDNGDGSALLTGTPTASGTFNLTFSASNSGGSATQNFVLTVNAAPAITSANNAAFTVGTAGSFTVTATGFPTPTLSESGALPSGVSFNASTGVLSGTPSTGSGGVYTVSFTAANGIGTNASQSFTLTVNEAPSITSPNSATFNVGTAAAFTVTATGFPAPTLSEAGALPPGVNFNSATGTLSGTPTASGVFNLVFTAHNGVVSDATQNFTLTVTQAPTITSANTTTFTAGTAGSFTVTATGFPTPSIVETGTLPAGVSFADNHNGTATLSGIPSSAGTFPVTFTASNGAGSPATQNFTLVVSPASTGPIATVSPTSINFGNVPLLKIAVNKVTLTNTGTSNLVISGVSLTLGSKTDGDDFFFFSYCKSPLGPGQSCVIFVSYFADGLGTKTATLNIRDNASDSPQRVSLTGTGVRRRRAD